MLGKIEGKRIRGQQRMRWLESITNWTDRNLSELQEIVEGRGAWCTAARGLAKSCIQLNDCELSHFSRVWLFVTPWTVSPPGSSVREILQARRLEWFAMRSSRGSFWPRDQTHVSCSSCMAGGFFTFEPLWKPVFFYAWRRLLLLLLLLLFWLHCMLVGS